MLTNQEKTAYREELFRHLDGIAVAPVAFTLKEKGVLDFLLQKESFDLLELTKHFNANEGYLNVALRMLASQGWLNYTVNNASNSVEISNNENSAIAFKHCDRFKDVVHFMKVSEEFHPRHFEIDQFSILNRIFNKYKNREYAPNVSEEKEKRIQAQIEKHIEGVLVGPITVFLGMDGMFHKYFMEASFSPEEFHEDPESFSKILDFFSFLGWFSKNNGNYKFTNKGFFFAKRSAAYGVTVSYIPTFRRVDELIFGNPNILRSSLPEATELHVDREMNVRSHRTANQARSIVGRTSSFSCWGRL